MYQVIEIVKPSGKNYNDKLMTNIAEGRYKVVFETEDKEKAIQKQFDKQIENTKNQYGLHYEIIEDGDPSPIFVENFETYKKINND